MPEQVTRRVLIGKPGLDGHDRVTNLMAPILDAERSYCSPGEICNMLRNVFDEYRGLQW